MIGSGDGVGGVDVSSRKARDSGIVRVIEVGMGNIES